MDLRIQKRTNPWNPRLWLAAVFAFSMQMQAVPALANPFAASQQKVQQCRQTEGQVAQGPCLEQDKVAPFTQQKGQALQANNAGQGGHEAATDAEAQFEANKAPIQQANVACQTASSGCQKECAGAKQQIDQDFQKCMQMAQQVPPQIPASVCNQQKKTLTQQAEGSKASCAKEGKEFDGNAMGALAALGALAAAALMAKKKSDGSAEKDSLACEHYDPATGILRGYENSYKPPTTSPPTSTVSEKETDDDTGTASAAPSQSTAMSTGAPPPKSPEGRPLFNPQCKTGKNVAKDDDKKEEMVCEEDIDCVCASPKTAEHKEVCGCYNAGSKTAVVSPFCNTVMEAHPQLKASIAQKYADLVEGSSSTDEKSGSNAYAADTLFSEKEQLQLKDQINIQDGPAMADSTNSSIRFSATADGGKRLPGYDDSSNESELANGTSSSGAGAQFSISSAKASSGSSPELARYVGARTPSSASVRTQNGINPAHGKGVFELISEAYKKQSRNLDQ